MLKKIYSQRICNINTSIRKTFHDVSFAQIFRTLDLDLRNSQNNAYFVDTMPRLATICPLYRYMLSGWR